MQVSRSRAYGMQPLMPQSESRLDWGSQREGGGAKEFLLVFLPFYCFFASPGVFSIEEGRLKGAVTPSLSDGFQEAKAGEDRTLRSALWSPRARSRQQGGGGGVVQ